MTWLAFIAEIVKATAWPVVVLVIVLVVRKPLVAILPSLKKVKLKDFEFEFGKELAQAEARIAGKLPVGSVKPLESPAGIVADLIAASPRAAVLESWLQVDRAARGAVVRLEFPQPVQPYVSAGKITSVLKGAQLLDADQAAVMESLRKLRNEAAHLPDFEISDEPARKYVELATRIADHLDSV